MLQYRTNTIDRNVNISTIPEQLRETNSNAGLELKTSVPLHFGLQPTGLSITQ